MNESLVIRVKVNNRNAIHTCWEKEDQFLQWSDMVKQPLKGRPNVQE